MDYRFQYLNYHNQFVKMLYAMGRVDLTDQQKLYEVAIRLVVARWQMVNMTELTARPTMARLHRMIDELDWTVFPPDTPARLKIILTSEG